MARYLTARTGHLMESAAVVGVDFTAAAVLAAAGPDRPDLQTMGVVEQRCSALARTTGLVDEQDAGEWPDGTVTARYRFRHALYQEVLYQHLAPSRRAAAHRRVGERLARAYGVDAGELAAELAMHFELGRDFASAIPFFVRAAETALQRIAHREALDYAERGLRLLERTATIPDRPAVELQLLMKEVVALVTLEGYSPTVDATYQRARTLCAELDDPTLFGPVLYGLWGIAFTRVRMTRPS